MSQDTEKTVDVNDNSGGETNEVAAEVAAAYAAMLEKSKYIVREATEYLNSNGYPLKVSSSDIDTYISTLRKMTSELAVVCGMTYFIHNMVMHSMLSRVELVDDDVYQFVQKEAQKYGVSFDSRTKHDDRKIVFICKDNPIIKDGTYQVLSLYQFLFAYLESFLHARVMWLSGYPLSDVLDKIKLANVKLSDM